MTIPTIFETCRPRADVLTGSVAEADFAADLAQVIAGRASAEYRDAGPFFRQHLPHARPAGICSPTCVVG